MRSCRRWTYAIVFLFLVLSNTAFGAVIHVDKNNLTPGDGSSWTMAVTTIQDAVDLADEDDEIWIAVGRYQPAATITINEEIHIYGQFSGTETSRDDRPAPLDSSMFNDNNTTFIDGNHTIECMAVSADATLDRLAIVNGNATDGGGIYIDNADPLINQCYFTDNEAIFGGAIFARDSEAAITDCEFFNNVADDRGGAIRIREAALTIEGSDFIANDAGEGGAVHNKSSATLFNNCLFEGNDSHSSGGGALYIHNIAGVDAKPEIKNCRFTLNDTGGSDGGNSIYLDNCSPDLSNCEFYNNYDSESMVMNLKNSSPIIKNCSFEDNSSYPTVVVLFIEEGSSPSIIESSFIGNSSSQNIGAIRIQSSAAPIFKNCVFADNAGDYTAAIRNYSSNTVIDGCIFYDNGGGLTVAGVVDNYDCSPLIVNSIFYENYVESTGGIMNFNASPIVVNCTFYGNRGESAGAIINDSASNPVIINSIFWNNRKNGELSQIEGNATVTYSLVQDGYPGVGNIDENPLFQNPDNGDFHLRTGSPAVDRGTALAADLPDEDYEGDDRHQGLAPDMGADETSFSLTIYYRDADRDGYGDPLNIKTDWSRPDGYVEDNTDCNDSNGAIHPGADEICNGLDDDCDGQTDEGVTTDYYRDFDGDGYGDASNMVQACIQPAGYVSDNSDCDDSNAKIYPGAIETCNGLDDNCDGSIDESFEKTVFYRDSDGDRYGDAATTIQACSAPPGYVDDNTDCNDSNASVHPGASEACNNQDDNCDGEIDEQCLKVDPPDQKQTSGGSGGGCFILAVTAE